MKKFFESGTANATFVVIFLILAVYNLYRDMDGLALFDVFVASLHIYLYRKVLALPKAQK